MKRIKKLLALLLTAVMTTLSFSGCASDPDSPLPPAKRVLLKK